MTRSERSENGNGPTPSHATVPSDDQRGGLRLVAYVVCGGDGAPPSSDELRSYLAEKLPQHMIPHTFVFLDDLPLTPNGKIDRKALPEPDAAPIGSAHVVPRTATEARVAEVWGELLGLGEPGIEENFFAMGGDSLLATKLIMRLRAAFQVDIPVRAIFEAPTITGLAKSIEPCCRPRQRA